jgi:hypothetical protein
MIATAPPNVRRCFAIEKPFKPNEFLLAVRQVLDGVPASYAFHP